MPQVYMHEDGRHRIKLSDEEALDLYNKKNPDGSPGLPLTEDQLKRLKERLKDELDDRLR